MSFSRLQLAAALIEYDNEEKNPYERKDAKQSAIFNTRRETRPTNAYVTTSTYSVPQDDGPRPPSHAGSSHQTIARQSMMSMGSNYERGQPADHRRDTRMTVGSNFGNDDDMMEDLEQEEPHGEVDLASWGIPDAFLDKRPLDKRDSRSMGRLASPRSPPHRTQAVRAMSMIGTEPLKDDPEDLRPLSPSVRNAISSMPYTAPHVDYSDRAAVPRPPAFKGDKSSKRNRTVSFHEFTAPQDDADDTEAEPMEIIRPGSSMSVLSRGRYEHPAFPPASPNRAMSRMSISSASYPTNVPLPASPSSAMGRPESMYAGTPGDEVANPFSLPAPAGNRVSRFDPKVAAHQRTSSRGSALPDRPDSRATGYFGAEPGMSDAQSRHGQPASPSSPHGSQMQSRLRLLRPKTLLMPTPLQGQLDPNDSTPVDGIDKRGFVVGRRPLPPGAVRPNSLLGSLPRSASGNIKSATQRMFADSLPVGGNRGDFFVGGADADGEVAFHQLGGQAAVEDDDRAVVEAAQTGTEDWRPVRPVTGLSLMDKLEERKAAQMAKRRVFTGDSRPTMMSRDDDTRRTLVDLASPDTPLSPPSMSSKRQTLAGDAGLVPPSRPGNDRHRSVFGVDQVWQREMAKKRREEEAERAAEEQVNGKRPVTLPVAEDFELGGGGAPSPAYVDDQDEDLHNRPLLDDSPRATTPLPVLPPISKMDDTPGRRAQHVDIDDWGASDDENPKPVRRSKKKLALQKKLAQPQADDDGSSDEDVPLTKAFNITVRPPIEQDDQSSSEDEPLAKLVAKSKPPMLPTIQAGSDAVNNDGDDEDDDVPLAVRRMTMMTLQTGKADEDDDDIPLAQKHLSAAHAQQQRQSTMYTNQQQQQQQHQQMMYQQQAMFSNPMAGGFGMPQMGMPMMGMPMMSPYMGMNPSMMSVPQLQPPQDPAIDRWRREVEIKEGSVIGSVRSGSGRT